MPRDSGQTRRLLLLAAEELFAKRGVWQVTTGDIVGAAGQRNTSALTYHFGPREKVLEAILIEHGEPIDARRGELLAALPDQPGASDWIGVLVSAIVPCLHTIRGRRYLQIVHQVSGLTFRSDSFPEAMPEHLTVALDGIRSAIGPAMSPALVAERIKAMVLLMTASLADRSNSIDRDAVGELGSDEYEHNLTAMLVGVVTGPVFVPAMS